MTVLPLRAFLDTNVVNYLFKWDQVDSAPIRKRLVRATSMGLVRVNGSLEVISELAGTIHVEPLRFPSMSNIYHRVVGRWWMLPFNKRHLAEVGLRGRLSDDALYLPRNLRLKLKGLGDRASDVARIDDAVRQNAHKYQLKAETDRTKVVARLREKSDGNGMEGVSDSAIRKGCWDWWANRDVADWCQYGLNDAVSRNGLDPDVSNLRDLKSVAPSLWHYMEYRLVRIALEVADRRRIQPSDEYDARHYSAAAVYSDVLVTEDKMFSEACEKIGEGAVKVIGLREFDHRVHTLLGGGYGVSLGS